MENRKILFVLRCQFMGPTPEHTLQQLMAIQVKAATCYIREGRGRRRLGGLDRDRDRESGDREALIEALPRYGSTHNM
jgi:hypothetical protein